MRICSQVRRPTGVITAVSRYLCHRQKVSKCAQYVCARTIFIHQKCRKQKYVKTRCYHRYTQKRLDTK